MNTSDFILVMNVSENGLAEGKCPPLCDGCGNEISKITENDYPINCLILDGDIFHSVQCDNCVGTYFGKVQKLSEEKVSKEIRQGVRLELAQEMQVISF